MTSWKSEWDGVLKVLHDVNYPIIYVSCAKNCMKNTFKVTLWVTEFLRWFLWVHVVQNEGTWQPWWYLRHRIKLKLANSWPGERQLTLDAELHTCHFVTSPSRCSWVSCLLVFLLPCLLPSQDRAHSRYRNIFENKKVI